MILKPHPIWDNFKGLFRAIDEGNPSLEIPAYHGGLFADNPHINNLVLSDDIFKLYKELADYDFLSDLSVTILGHIFEHSITDLELLKKQIAGGNAQDLKDNRKHDEGAYYTPPPHQ